MESLLYRLPPGARVAVIRLRSLGDCVLTTPALEILKRSRPELRVSVVVESRFEAVFEGNPDVDDLLAPDWRELRAWRPDLCLNLHGGTRSLAMALLSGARLRAGFAHFRGSFLYDVRIPRAQEILGVERLVHTAEHLASAMFYLGAAPGEIPGAKLFAPAWPAPRSYAVFHPLASEPAKTWPAERFLAVAEHLKSWGVDPVFIGGPGEDLGVFSGYRTLPGAPLATVKSLLRSASLFVGNDSGPAHMAGAFRIPVVVLFGGSDPVVWAPWKTASQVLVGRPIESIEVAQVLEALDRLKVPA